MNNTARKVQLQTLVTGGLRLRSSAEAAREAASAPSQRSTAAALAALSSSSGCLPPAHITSVMSSLCSCTKQCHHDTGIHVVGEYSRAASAVKRVSDMQLQRTFSYLMILVMKFRG